MIASEAGVITELRPRASETFVCPCGSQWFTRRHKFDTAGFPIEREAHFECAGGCGRKHHGEAPVSATVQPIRKART